MKTLMAGVSGALLAAAFFWALDWNVYLYQRVGALWPAISLHVLRLLGVGAVFAVFARIGASPLLAGLAGFELTRVLALRLKGSWLEMAT